MNTTLLLPNKFKKLGWLILIPSTVFGLIISVTDYELNWLNTKVFAIFNSDLGQQKYFSVIDNNITNEVVGVLFLIGGLLVTFSKEKDEDEYIASLRVNSLLWSVLVNYGLLLFAFIFVFGFSFLQVMMYNMFTTLIIFIIRFNYVLFKNSKLSSNEK